MVLQVDKLKAGQVETKTETGNPGSNPGASVATEEAESLESALQTAAGLVTRDLDESLRADDELNMAASAGNNDLAFDRVKSKYRLVLTHLSGYNDTSMPSLVRVGYWNGHRYNWLNTVGYPMASETVGFNGKVYLRHGMYPVVRFEGCTAGDDLYTSLNGYLLKK